LATSVTISAYLSTAHIFAINEKKKCVERPFLKKGNRMFSDENSDSRALYMYNILLYLYLHVPKPYPPEYPTKHKRK